MTLETKHTKKQRRPWHHFVHKPTFLGHGLFFCHSTMMKLQLAVLLLCLATVIAGESTSVNFSGAIVLHNRKSLRSAHSMPATTTNRKLEDYWNENKYDNNNGGSNSDTYKKTALQTTGNMFSIPPNQWSPLQWCIFAFMLFTFASCFFCWCVVCVIPRCCGQKGTLMYSAMLV